MHTPYDRFPVLVSIFSFSFSHPIAFALFFFHPPPSPSLDVTQVQDHEAGSETFLTHTNCSRKKEDVATNMCPCGTTIESRTHIVGKCEIHKEERDVLEEGVEEIRRVTWKSLVD